MKTVLGVLTVTLTIFCMSCTETRSRIVRVGSSFSLACTPDDADEILHYFEWSKEGVNLPERSWNDPNSRFEILSNFSLLVHSVVEEDSGNYSCRIQSDPPRITSYYVQVEAPPRIEQHPSHNPIVAREGSNVSLFCLATGRPAPDIVWKHQEGAVILTKNIETTVNENGSVSSVLKLQEVTRNQSGIISCTADNGVSKDPASGRFHLEITYAPEIRIEHPWVHAGLGSLAELICIVDAQPLAHVSWYFNGSMPVYGTNRLGLLVDGKKHILRFKSVSDTDLGIYSCRAHSLLGQAEAALQLSGLAGRAALKVEPPRDGPKIEEEQTTYRLTWNVVSHSPLYEYRLKIREQSRNPKDGDWKSIIIPALPSSSAFLHSQQYKLRGLVLQKTYQVAVQSRNRFGWSDDSNVVTISTGEVDDESNLVEDPEDEEEFIRFTTSIPTTTTSTTAITAAITTTATSTAATTRATTQETIILETVTPVVTTTTEPATVTTTATTLAEEVTTEASSPYSDLPFVEEHFIPSFEGSADTSEEWYSSTTLETTTATTVAERSALTTLQLTTEARETGSAEEDLSTTLPTIIHITENQADEDPKQEKPLPAFASKAALTATNICPITLITLLFIVLL